MYASNKSSCFRREGAQLMDGLANIVDIPGQCHGPVTTQDWEGHCVTLCVCVCVFVRACTPPSAASSPSSLPLRPWGSLQSAEPYLTETRPPYKSHPPIYLMCSSTRTPSIHPQGARISKHSNSSLGVAISAGLELYSQIPKSLWSSVPEKESARCGLPNYSVFQFISF